MAEYTKEKPATNPGRDRRSKAEKKKAKREQVRKRKERVDD